ncbi:MAG TPA: hypothetical protein VLD19_01945 [Chitinophagaceae bacterium]|nr:hypothetical protein [Chitinophagaceae bacterium]
MSIASFKTLCSVRAGRLILFCYRCCLPLLRKKHYSRTTLLQNTHREIFLVKKQTILSNHIQQQFSYGEYQN